REEYRLERQHIVPLEELVDIPAERYQVARDGVSRAQKPEPVWGERQVVVAGQGGRGDSREGQLGGARGGLPAGPVGRVAPVAISRTARASPGGAGHEQPVFEGLQL